MEEEKIDLQLIVSRIEKLEEERKTLDQNFKKIVTLWESFLKKREAPALTLRGIAMKLLSFVFFMAIFNLALFQTYHLFGLEGVIISANIVLFVVSIWEN